MSTLSDELLFKGMEQQQNETLGSFVERLRNQSEKCHFVDSEAQMKLQIIAGCLNNRLRREALEDKMTLKQIISRGRTLEEADRNSEDLPEDSILSENKPKCLRCGYIGGYEDHIYKNQKCPAITARCLTCKHHGHFGRMCQTSIKNRKRFSFEMEKSGAKYQKHEASRTLTSNRANIEQPSTSRHIITSEHRANENSFKSNSSIYPKILPRVRTPEYFDQPMQNVPNSKDFYNCQVGGMTLKCAVSSRFLVNVMGKNLSRRVIAGGLAHHSADTVPVTVGNDKFDGLFTSKIQINEQNHWVNFYTYSGSADLQEIVYITTKLAQLLGLKFKN